VALLISGCDVFIHRSIKTRIETRIHDGEHHNGERFLYIDPLKQGLKHNGNRAHSQSILFLYIDPLKQGLKLAVHWAENETQMFLYIDPLKQGLKLHSGRN